MVLPAKDFHSDAVFCVRVSQFAVWYGEVLLVVAIDYHTNIMLYVGLSNFFFIFHHEVWVVRSQYVTFFIISDPLNSDVCPNHCVVCSCYHVIYIGY